METITSDAAALAVLASLLPLRRSDANKGDFGRLTVVAGSSCYRGAARLAVSAALRSGVGLVRLVSTEPVIAAVAAGVPECTFLPVAATPDGGMLASDFRAKLPLLTGKGAFLVGCGMGASADTEAIVSALTKSGQPLVIDADGINVLCRHPAALGGAIITPHVGEMSRLTGRPIPEIKAERRRIARDFAVLYGCITVLKDAITVVATPEGEVTVCERPNDGLAKGGSGDVLAGLIASLAAQGLSLRDAALGGVLLHSLAAAQAAAIYGAASMLPSDLVTCLGSVYLTLRKETLP